MSVFRSGPAATPQTNEELAARVDAIIRAAEKLNMESLTSREHLSARLADLRMGRNPQVLLCTLGGGILDFVAGVFPNRGERPILAQHFLREPEGRGAHFDVYGELLAEEFPWVAVFNVAGDVEVSALPLPLSLARRYGQEHPEPTDEAFEARRMLAAQALADPGVTLSIGALYGQGGLIIPQSKAGPHWIHRIAPFDPKSLGQFVKVLVPANDAGAHRALADDGYVSLDGLLTAALRSSDATLSSSKTFPGFRRCKLD